MAKKIVTHVIHLEVEEQDEPLIRAIADKYIFTGEGIRQIDAHMNKFHLVITPMMKKMVRAK